MIFNLHHFSGIYDIYIDLSQQKITIIGWADLEKIVKAIKKTRKIATICSHIEPTESSSQPAESPSQPENPAPDTTQQPAETPPAQAEPPKDTPPPEVTPSPKPTENNESQKVESTQSTNDAGEVHVIYHHPPNYGNANDFGHSYAGHQERCHNSPVFLRETPAPIHVTHSYNTYDPSSHLTAHVYARSPPTHTPYSHIEYSSGDYYNGNGKITSMFSDENPNACTIV